MTKGIENGDDAETCLNAMCEAAREGVEFTKTIRATKGRASYLGDRSIGHQDPGATSATITLEAIGIFIWRINRANRREAGHGRSINRIS